MRMWNFGKLKVIVFLSALGVSIGDEVSQREVQPMTQVKMLAVGLHWAAAQ